MYVLVKTPGDPLAMTDLVRREFSGVALLIVLREE